MSPYPSPLNLLDAEYAAFVASNATLVSFGTIREEGIALIIHREGESIDHIPIRR
jgi:hypothetical protein